MENDNGTIYDDVLRTLQERHPELLIPLVNEVFHTAYSQTAKVTRLPEEYQKVVSKVIADSCSMIENCIYHIECQSTKNGKMVLRMVEYDFFMALAHTEKQDGHYRLRMPKSCVLYLRGGTDISDKEELQLELADGQIVSYCVPNVNIEDYTIDKIFEKKLLLFLPYYIMRYEKQFKTIAQNEESVKRLEKEYNSILMQLLKETETNEEGLLQDIIRLIQRIMDYQLRKESNLKERMDKVMGGKVLDLPSDQLREERRKGIEEGIERGIEALIETCREVGIRQENTAAKLRTKFNISEELVEQYMAKYWS